MPPLPEGNNYDNSQLVTTEDGTVILQEMDRFHELSCGHTDDPAITHDSKCKWTVKTNKYMRAIGAATVLLDDKFTSLLDYFE